MNSKLSANHLWRSKERCWTTHFTLPRWSVALLLFLLQGSVSLEHEVLLSKDAAKKWARCILSSFISESAIYNQNLPSSREASFLKNKQMDPKWFVCGTTRRAGSPLKPTNTWWKGRAQAGLSHPLLDSEAGLNFWAWVCVTRLSSKAWYCCLLCYLWDLFPQVIWTASPLFLAHKQLLQHLT